MSEMNSAERENTLLPPQDQLPEIPAPAWAPPPTAPPPVGPPPAPNDSVWNRIAAFLVLVAVVAAAAGAGIGWSLARVVNNHPVAQSSSQSLSPITQVTPGTGSSNGTTSADSVAAKVRPAVVDINTKLGSSQAAGTGMLISSTGEILTNNHVVTGSTSITVTLQGGSRDYTAHVVGVNVSQDVAVIQIDQSVSGLPTVTFANSSSVQVGDAVVAIGNALGQGGAPASSGQVTALDQTITASEGRQSSESLSGLIQSDATIYPGDSGGALVNTSGQVIGMITAGEAQGFRSQSGTDVGYAVSANTAVKQANRILAHEQGSDLTYGQVGYLGVSVQDSSAGGVLVVGVQRDSPAASAGITAGSVITSIGGTTVTSTDSLSAAIKSHRPGDSVAVKWTDSSGTGHSATVSFGAVNP